jgi:hypothetical protein
MTNTFAYNDLRESYVLGLRVLLEKAVVIYLVKNLPDFYETSGLIIVFTRDRQ